MKGTVTEINQSRGMAAVFTEENFSIIELLNEGIEVGDELSWIAIHPLGSEIISNLTKGERVEVYFQNHWVPKTQLPQQLLY